MHLPESGQSMVCNLLLLLELTELPLSDAFVVAEVEELLSVSGVTSHKTSPGISSKAIAGKLGINMFSYEVAIKIDNWSKMY